MRELVAPLGVEPAQVALSARYAWQVRLSNGVVLELGRDDSRSPVEERLARFVAAYPRIAASLNRPLDYVDLRYPNGFAIRVPDLLQGVDGDTQARKRS
jgi:cell division protein FtsQ